MLAFLIIYCALLSSSAFFIQSQGQTSLRHLIKLDVSYASLCVALHCRKEENRSFRTARSNVRKREFSDCRARQCADPASGAGLSGLL